MVNPSRKISDFKALDLLLLDLRIAEVGMLNARKELEKATAVTQRLFPIFQKKRKVYMEKFEEIEEKAKELGLDIPRKGE